jgi:hypothetical protein
MHMATTLTYPERVTEVNLTTLRRRVLNGSAAWPGANFVALADGARIWLADEKVRRQRANELKVRRDSMGGRRQGGNGTGKREGQEVPQACQ